MWAYEKCLNLGKSSFYALGKVTILCFFFKVNIRDGCDF